MNNNQEKKPLLRRIYDEIYEFLEAVVIICGNILRDIWRTLMKDGRFRGRLIMILISMIISLLFVHLFKSSE